jgi:hypothetical protein
MCVSYDSLWSQTWRDVIAVFEPKNAEEVEEFGHMVSLLTEARAVLQPRVRVLVCAADAKVTPMLFPCQCECSSFQRPTPASEQAPSPGP